jgi:8-oxo-dGTP pyrophosphatase MutT (NUDIX family)
METLNGGKAPMWRTKSSKTVYRNPWIRVREDEIVDPAGRDGIYGVVEIPPGVFIVARDAGARILLIEQTHYPTGRRSWELPGGGIEPGYTHEQQALEELAEEALVTAAKFTPLGTTQAAPGVTTELNHFMLAEELSPLSSPELAAKQKAEGIGGAAFFTDAEVRRMIREGKIDHGQTITGYFLYLLSQE